MKFIFDTSEEVISHFEREDYFSIRVVFSDGTDNNYLYSDDFGNHYLYFNQENINDLEFSLHSIRFHIKKILMICCNNYEFKYEKMDVPVVDKRGKVIIKGASKVNCSYFNMIVYNDGVRIDLSESEPIKYFQTGQLILLFDSKEKLVNIYITNLTEKDIEHVKEELKLHN